MSTDEQQMPQYPLAKTFPGRAMDLDPTKNDDLHLYVWNQLKKRIETEISL